MLTRSLPAILLTLFILIPSVAAATDATDPRNAAGFQTLFDYASTSDRPIADGYGGYIQHYEVSPTSELFRFCDNFQGEGLRGRPNLSLQRKVFVPITRPRSPTAYDCFEFPVSEVLVGRPMIQIKEKYFFFLKAESWKTNEGGILLFQIAKKVPLTGKPIYKIIRLRVSRSGPGKPWLSEMIVPKGEIIPAHWLQFVVGSSGLGIPNRIESFTLNPSLPTERSFDLDTLEDPR